LPPHGIYVLFTFWLFPGDNHVFRFNDPEAVRKQRDRATLKSNLHLSVTAADLDGGEGSPGTRPDSPTSSADGADVDWTFAKREAAFARLGLDPTLDNLPDDDLNKLYEKITKVKTMRDHNMKPSRPESSMSMSQSQADDVWSETGRPFSSDATTDDTSVDAAPSVGSPELDGSLTAVQSQLEQRLQAITESSTEAEDLKVEKDHMEHQLRLVRTQMRRLIDARARGETDAGAVEFEPVIYSAKQLRLIRKVLDRWRAHRAFSMAEVVLSNAVVMKEANIIRQVLSFHWV
jgi:kinesin family protein 1